MEQALIEAFVRSDMHELDAYLEYASSWNLGFDEVFDAFEWGR